MKFLVVVSLLISFSSFSKTFMLSQTQKTPGIDFEEFVIYESGIRSFERLSEEQIEDFTSRLSQVGLISNCDSSFDRVENSIGNEVYLATLVNGDEVLYTSIKKEIYIDKSFFRTDENIEVTAVAMITLSDDDQMIESINYRYYNIFERDLPADAETSYRYTRQLEDGQDCSVFVPEHQ